MKVKELDLQVPYEKHGLTPPESLPTFTGYILQNYAEYCPNRKRPAVIICPGGGYRITSHREAVPVGIEMISSGITAFVLHYSPAPSRFPTSLLELATAVSFVREHADEYNIDPDNISVMGFSAGGHLVGCLGVFWNHQVLKDLGFNDQSHKPNSVVMCYPVISALEHPHSSSFQNLLGENPSKQQLEQMSIERHVTKDMPPVFLWHTFSDPTVPVQNSLLFANAAAKCGVTTELHIFPQGKHGLSLGNDTVNDPENVQPLIHNWIQHVVEFIKNTPKI